MFSLNRTANIRAIVLFIALAFAAISCRDIKESDATPDQSFSKIYNSAFPTDNIYPLEIQQTSTGDFLVLSEGRDRRVHLMKTDKDGNIKSDTVLDAQFVNPLPFLDIVNNKVVIFCEKDSSISYALTFPLDSTTGIEAHQINVSNLLSVGKTTDGYLFQHWNMQDKKTLITKVSPNFAVGASTEFEVKAEVQDIMLSHKFRKADRLPFFSVQINNRFYINGFFDYNFGLVFLDHNLSETGRVPGYKNEKKITSIFNINANQVAVAASEYDKSFFAPAVEINPDLISSMDKIELPFLPEMSINIPVFLKKIKLAGAEVMIFAFTTKSNQIALYCYNTSSGALLGKHIIGHTNPYEVSNFIQTSDEGLVVLAKTQVAGRFPRISIIKFSKEELGGMFLK